MTDCKIAQGVVVALNNITGSEGGAPDIAHVHAFLPPADPDSSPAECAYVRTIPLGHFFADDEDQFDGDKDSLWMEIQKTVPTTAAQPSSWDITTTVGGLVYHIAQSDSE
jgi:hypothetical protein